ncbi:rhamnogalacturonan lyase [Paenibacillus sp. GCM10023248]|uniref:rhamnogalacturonan lyase n=1 Tax=unclassified Paenibacillus TaxID=185978 RepID=UPI002379AF14|nr:rhamnogalacturonan lyase [Paenibacillus sp. MAHUQ-63]MDD9269444.1 rhamnogalacturonan lyase [Paenibacillus sp. MAHUQ-63]
MIEANDNKNAAVQLEYLGRGLVAAATSEGVFLSWRLLGNEVTGHSDKGLTGTDFNLYRDGILLTAVRDSTNYLDRSGTLASVYVVCAVVNGQEVDRSEDVVPWESPYYELPLRKPADGMTPTGQTYTYAANDMSVGDVDGDGEYEYFVKWDPSNSKDVSHSGYTGPVYIDCYKLDGTLLYRIDLGVNIRAGAHYTQFLVYDFDGDGKAELMFKTAPGTKIIRYDREGRPSSEAYITMPSEDIAAGYSHQDDYRMSSRDYYEHIVRMFMRWDKHEEVVAGHWPSTLEACFGIDNRYRYPLSREDAERLADHFIDVYAPSRSGRNSLRSFEGFILEGPEYITVFHGETGEELETIPYKPGRHDDGLMWGDYAWNRIEPGNRVDRFLAGVAYLDGRKPYAIFARGYYTRAAVVSYSWDGAHLKEHWVVDSGWMTMNNPFHNTLRLEDGRDEHFGSLAKQGAHSLSIADVDGDGCHEIIYGAATIDHDGTILYSSRAVMPPESKAPGRIVKLGHGDALHVANIDPDREGLEIFMVHESGEWGPYGYTLRDAATGEILFGGFAADDVGRGMVGQVDPAQRGLQVWCSEGYEGDEAFGLMTCRGEQISKQVPGTNMNIRWSADMTTQVVSGRFAEPVAIEDWRRGKLLTAEGTSSNNGTKGNPCLVADVFGDWREELLVRTSDSSAIRIYLSTEITDRKMYTLMHDAQYRTGIAWQNVVYNQPCYTSFYFASDMDWAKMPIPNLHLPKASQ